MKKNTNTGYWLSISKNGMPHLYSGGEHQIIQRYKIYFIIIG